MAEMDSCDLPGELTGQMEGRRCTFCGDYHGTLSERFCSWCLSDDPKERRNHHSGRVYAIWRRDRDGRRICRDCYDVLLTREKAAGIVHTAKKQSLYETISQMKDRLFVQPEHKIIDQIGHLRHKDKLAQPKEGKNYRYRAAMPENQAA